jgi:hypothetical protein
VGECPFFGELGDGHFGHIRFKKIPIFDFDGHMVESEIGAVNMKSSGMTIDRI